MKQTASIISTYAADVSGVCSALYELGGMVVMHDPSGCNSTYNTHDEPRWYDYDSLIFISALSEMEAIMGDDQRLIDEVVETAQQLKPRFIAIAGSPVPMVIGTDFTAIARVIEKKTGIPCFGFTTNGMHSYLSGAGMALEAVAERMTLSSIQPEGKHRVNILGATPLDFSVNSSVESIKGWLKKSGFEVNSCWAMGSTLEELSQAGKADVNLVISQSGWKTANVLFKKFGTPYVVGVPVGKTAAALAKKMKKTEETGESSLSVCGRQNAPSPKIKIIAESVYGTSLAAALEEKLNRPVQVICPLEGQSAVMGPNDLFAKDESQLIPLLADAEIIIADPLYQAICPKIARFIPLATEAFSGRIYRAEIPDLIAENLDRWFTAQFQEVKK